MCALHTLLLVSCLCSLSKDWVTPDQKWLLKSPDQSFNSLHGKTQEFSLLHPWRCLPGDGRTPWKAQGWLKWVTGLCDYQKLLKGAVHQDVFASLLCHAWSLTSSVSWQASWWNAAVVCVFGCDVSPVEVLKYGTTENCMVCAERWGFCWKWQLEMWEEFSFVSGCV